MSDLLVVYGVKAEIDVGSPSSSNFVELGEGFNNISETLNEVVQQYFFLDGKGFASNYVTGMAPAYTFTGVRVRGDAAQDYIFSTERKYGLMSKRDTKFKITISEGDNTTVITCPVTLCGLTDIGGATTDGSAVSVEIRFNGKPTVETQT